MPFNRFFDPLRLNADVSLGRSGGAVLQEPLDKGNIKPIRLVNLGGVPLAEAVGADALKAQVITDDGKLLLDGSLRDRKQAIKNTSFYSSS